MTNVLFGAALGISICLISLKLIPMFEPKPLSHQTVMPQRLYSGAHTARKQRAYSVLTALISFTGKCFTFFSKTCFANIVTYMYLNCSKQCVVLFNSCTNSCRSCNMFSKTHVQSSNHRIDLIAMCFS